MFESIPQNTITASSANCLSGGSAFCGPDIMVAIEMMLVKDYDDQLKSTAAQMKTMTKVKQAYRDLIQKLNSFLIRPAQNVDVQGDNVEDLKPCVPLSQSEYNEYFCQDISYIGDSSTITFHEETQSVAEEDQPLLSTHDGTLFMERTAIESTIENYKMKLETLNEQTEITSLSLQTLTSQRKVAFEAVSNIIKKQEDAVGTIIRNMG